MKSVGQGVFELRQRDAAGWYRIIYLKRIGSRLFVLHCFIKKSAKTPTNDLEIAARRLGIVQAKVAAEKKEERHGEKGDH
ncbi:hypothetical protein Pla175_12030 [Pirellulimonas nuda]|uniref:Phage derived protein Gp49-like (DUF891) n=1 Tax=Pirellulimonas nuda TaxID=2528009 RepID=A0A518D8P2_9BACT|nr:hypothetical protein Pla175_12030 [Pirellulimonas nuda]